MTDGNLDEASASELASGSNRGNAFSPRTAGYEGLSFRTKKLRFRTGKYDQELVIPDIKVISRMKGTDEEKIRIALDGDIKVHCTCPDFRYGGFQYMGTQLGYSSKALEIPAPVRNPRDEGTVCKHLKFVLSRIGDYVDDIAADFGRARKTKWYSTVRRTVESVVPTFSEFVSERLGVPDGLGTMADALADAATRFWEESVPGAVRNQGQKARGGHETVPVRPTAAFPLAEVELLMDWRIHKGDGGKGFVPNIEGSFAGLYRDRDRLGARILLRVVASENSVLGGDGWAEGMRKLTQSSAVHELTHAFESYQRSAHHKHDDLTLSFGGMADQTQARMQEFVAQVPAVSRLLFTIYLCASYEVNARVAQMEPLLRGKTSTADRMEAVRGSDAWKQARELIDFRAADVYKELTAACGDEAGVEALIVHIENKLRTAAVGPMLSYVFGQTSLLNHQERVRALSFFTSHGARYLAEVSKKKPRAFLDFWEKRARRVGEELRRKLLRTVAY